MKSIACAAALCCMLLGICSWAGESRWMTYRIDLPAGAVCTEVELRLNPVEIAGAVPLTVPALLLRQGQEAHLAATLPPLTSGTWQIVGSWLQDGERKTLQLDGARTFAGGAYDVVLVIDASFSMRLNDPEELRDAALRRFLAMARQSQAIRTVGIVAFRTHSDIVLPLTPPGQIDNVEELLAALSPGGLTDFDEPLDDALTLLQAGQAPDRAVLFLSDGEPRGGYRETHRKLADRGIPLYTIGLTDEADMDLLGRMAEESGGQSFTAPAAAQLNALFVRIFHLLDRPVMISRRVLDAAGEDEGELLLDPSLHNPMLRLAPTAGAPVLAVNGTTVYAPEMGDLVLHHFPAETDASLLLALTGEGRLMAELLASSSLVLHTLQANAAAPRGLPLRAWARLSQLDERVGQIEATARVVLPDGTVEQRVLTPDPATGLYLIDWEAGQTGIHTVTLEVRGTIDGAPFLRTAAWRFERTQSGAARMAAGAPLPAPLQAPTPTLRMPTLQQAPALPRTTPSAEQELRTMWWASTDGLDFQQLYPGSSDSQSLDVQLNATRAAPLAVAFEGSLPEGIALRLEGQLHLDRRSTLSIIATAAPEAAGLAFEAALVVRFGDEAWRIPVRGEVKVPQLRVTSSPVTVREGADQIEAESRLTIALEPAGSVPATIETDLRILRISPSAVVATSEGGVVELSVELAVPPPRTRWAGSITVTAPGLAPVVVPYELTLSERLRPAAGEQTVQTTSFDWRQWLIALFVLVTLLLLLAALRGNRRAVFMLVSLLIHVAILFLVLPRPDEELSGEPEPVSVLTVTSGDVTHEEQIASELAETDLAEVEPSPAAAEKEAAELAAQTAEASQALEAEAVVQASEQVAETRKEAVEQVEREALRPEEMLAAAAALERRQAESQPEEKTPRASQEEAPAAVKLPDASTSPDRAAVQVTSLAKVEETAQERPVEQPVERQDMPVRELASAPDAPSRRATEAVQEERAARDLLAEPLRTLAPAASTIAPAMALAVTGLADVHETAPERPLEETVERPAVPTQEVASQAHAPERRTNRGVDSEATAETTPRGSTGDFQAVAQPVDDASATGATVGAGELPTASPAALPQDGKVAGAPTMIARQAVPLSGLTDTSAEAPARISASDTGSDAQADQPLAGTGRPSAAALPAESEVASRVGATVPAATGALPARSAPTAHVAMASPVPTRLSPTGALPSRATTENGAGQAKRSADTPSTPGMPRTMPGEQTFASTPDAQPGELQPGVATIATPALTTGAVAGSPRGAVPNLERPELASGDPGGVTAESHVEAAPVGRRQSVPGGAESMGAARAADGEPVALAAVGGEVAPRRGTAALPAPTAELGSGQAAAPRPLRDGDASQRPSSPATDLFSPARPTSSPRRIAGGATIRAASAPLPMSGQGLAQQLVASTEATRQIGSQRAASMPPSPEIAMPGGEARRPPAVSLVRGVERGGRGVPSALPLLQYGGDWDCDPTAMLNLAHQLERRTGSVLPIGSRTIGLASNELSRLPFLFMTGHDPFSFTPEEVAQLRKYLEAGGALWLNDSTDLGDNDFDAAVRRELARVLPRAEFRPIPSTSNLFKAPYDLTNGYLGYQIPPGDKYRQDYLEGLWIDDRLAVIYTRNDYGDGLEIDPHTHPLMTSLSDLSPQEMQEGSIRMGSNIVFYFQNRGQLPDEGLVARLREDAAEQQRPGSQLEHLRPIESPLFADRREWTVPEGWSDVLPGSSEADDEGALIVRWDRPGTAVSRRDKVVIGAPIGGDVSQSLSIVLDAQSGLSGGARLAVAFITGGPDGTYYESAPRFLRPGANEGIVFSLSDATWKSAATEWEYRAELPATLPVAHWFFIIYPQQPSGQVTLQGLRLMAPIE